MGKVALYMESKPLIIKRNPMKEDNHCFLTVRLQIELLEKLDRTAYQANISRNKLINLILEYQVDHIQLA